jgi:hypothetical protein
MIGLQDSVNSPSYLQHGTASCVTPMAGRHREYTGMAVLVGDHPASNGCGPPVVCRSTNRGRNAGHLDVGVQLG